MSFKVTFSIALLCLFHLVIVQSSPSSCNCGLGSGTNVCRGQSCQAQVVRPQPLPLIDHPRPRIVCKTIGGVEPLKPIGDLCSCGQTIVKPAIIPKPACSGCGGIGSQIRNGHSKFGLLRSLLNSQNGQLGTGLNQGESILGNDGANGGQYVNENGEINLGGSYLNGNGDPSLNGNDGSYLSGNGGSYLNGNGGSYLNGNGGSYLNGNGDPSLNGNDGSYLSGSGGSYLNGNGGSYLNGNGGSYLNGNGDPSLNGNDDSYLNGNGGSYLNGNGGSYLNGNGDSYLNGNGGSYLNGNGGSYLNGNGDPSLNGNGGSYLGGNGGDYQVDSLGQVSINNQDYNNQNGPISQVSNLGELVGNSWSGIQGDPITSSRSPSSHVPADPVSQSIALQRSDVKTHVSDSKLQFGFHKLPQNLQRSTKRTSFPEGNIQRLNGPVLELKVVADSGRSVDEEAIEDLVDEEPEVEAPTQVRKISLGELGYGVERGSSTKFINVDVEERQEKSCASEPHLYRCNDGFRGGQVVINEAPVPSEVYVSNKRLTPCSADEQQYSNGQDNLSFLQGPSYSYSSSSSNSNNAQSNVFLQRLGA